MEARTWGDDIDTGLDFTHPNLKHNVDFKNSVSCIGGIANTSPAAWMDDNGHGTHTAGTIAAGGMNGCIVGVAPNVRIAAIKAGDVDGFFFPEAVVSAFMWAGRHHMDVTNNSYFADPLAVQLPQRPRPARHLRGGEARDGLCDGQRRHHRGRRRQRERRSRQSDRRQPQPRFPG